MSEGMEAAGGPIRRALVTGGGGFLGSAIINALLARGVKVRSVARGDYPLLRGKGVETVQCDVSDGRVVLVDACRGCDVVFHVAAKAGVWGSYEEFHRANVGGTEQVLTACRAAGVRRLVYTSSPSVVFAGGDQEGIDESTPYPSSYHAHYPRTKAAAERLVLGANGPGLATVALRPHLIWGPGDPHMIPRIIERARAGKLRIVGSGTNRVDTVYVDNAALAHLDAAERLAPRTACAGQAYFIAQGEPRPLWDVVNDILRAANLPPVTRRVSARRAYWAGAVMELIWTVLGRKSEPPMTRFVARELSTSHWFDLTAAKRDLGYHPVTTYGEGILKLQGWLRTGAGRKLCQG